MKPWRRATRDNALFLSNGCHLELHRFLPCRSDSEKRGMYMMCSRASDDLWLICGPGVRLTQAIDDPLPEPDIVERLMNDNGQLDIFRYEEAKQDARITGTVLPQFGLTTDHRLRYFFGGGALFRRKDPSGRLERLNTEPRSLRHGDRHR